MPLISRINQYRGVNAHFQSYAQSGQGNWRSFHGMHIAHLAEMIQEILPPGYEVLPEESLQIQVDKQIHFPRPDITIWQVDKEHRDSAPSALTIATPVATRPVIETLAVDIDNPLRAVVIKDITRNGEGIPVTRIELLSPTNKAGIGQVHYLNKRDEALQSGVNLVEIDYLHETNSPVPGIPGYARAEQGAYLYLIIVSNPNPTLKEGQTILYGFHADEKMLPIKIPLSGKNTISLDFGTAYKHTFESLTAYTRRVDYAREPLHFESYHRGDWIRIWRRMLAVWAAHRKKNDINEPVADLLEDYTGIKQVENLEWEQANLFMDETSDRLIWLTLQDATINIIDVQGTAVNEEKIILSGEKADAKAAGRCINLKDIFNHRGMEVFLNSLEYLRRV